MSVAEDKLAQELRDEVESRIRSWKTERAALLLAQTRIAELDALIAFAETETPTIKIAPRPRVPISPTTTKTPTSAAK